MMPLLLSAKYRENDFHFRRKSSAVYNNLLMNANTELSKSEQGSSLAADALFHAEHALTNTPSHHRTEQSLESN